MYASAMKVQGGRPPSMCGAGLDRRGCVEVLEQQRRGRIDILVLEGILEARREQVLEQRLCGRAGDLVPW